MFTDPGDRRFVGMWWGGFFLCGVLLLVLAVPFLAFPKTLRREKERIRLQEKSKPAAITAGLSGGVDQEKATASSAAPPGGNTSSLKRNQHPNNSSCCSKVMGEWFSLCFSSLLWLLKYTN